MPLIVAVHGIGQQFKGPNVLHSEWYPPLRDGLAKAGVKLDRPSDLACPFYGDLFRPAGTKSGGRIHYDANDVTEVDEKKLLEDWWREAAKVEKGRVPDPDDDATKGRAPQIVQMAAQLSHFEVLCV